MIASVWVFNGARAMFPSGVFTSRGSAEGWIAKHALTGTLTHYPTDTGMYEFAIAGGQFVPKKPHHYTAEFIGAFSGGGLYADGKPAGGGEE